LQPLRYICRGYIRSHDSDITQRIGLDTDGLAVPQLA
jgi:hypothetical protein